MTGTPTKRRTTSNSEATLAIAEALNTLNSRIEKTESDFLGHLQKVEDRLDQIVDLTKTVAVLQQQTIQQTDQIAEVRNQLRENAQKFENSVTRIHSRLDDITNHQRDKLELTNKEFELRIKSVSDKSDETDKTLRTWLNRGLGGWAIFALIFGIAQTMTVRWADNIEKDRVSTYQSIQQFSSFKDRSEIQHKQFEIDLTELKATIKAIDRRK